MQWCIDRLKGPERPAELEYLVKWFWELMHVKEAGPHGLQPLTYQAVSAWAELTGRTPDTLEVEALMLMDRNWRNPGKDEG